LSMSNRGFLPAISPAVALSFIFTVALSYTGAGYNLHRLSLCGLLLALWLAISITKLDLSRLRLAWGWLPATVIMYFGWLLLAPFVSTYPYASFTTAMGLAALPLAFLGWWILSEKNKQQAWRLTWHLLLTLAVVLSVWGIADFLVQHRRAHASFLDPSAYAALINLFLLPAAYAYLTAPPSARRLENPNILLCVIALLALAQSMTLSRGALLALIGTLPALLWLTRSYPAFRLRCASLLSVLISAYLLVQLAPFAPPQGSASFLTPESDSVSGRLLLLKSAWRMIGDSNLLYGTGIGTFKTYYSAYRETGDISLGNFVHNDYLQALLEGGLVQTGFFLLLTVIAPLWLLLKSAPRSGGSGRSSGRDIAPGLMLGIVSVSLHALVNFIHYVGPISLLTGLYLARCWETIQPCGRFNILRPIVPYVKPAFAKALLILVLAVPIAALVVDGIIFKLFATNDSIHTRLEAGARLAALNLSLAVRPGNPMPRIFLIRGLLIAAEKSETDVREALLRQAERETTILSAQAPALAISRHFYMGKIRVLRGTPGDMILAQQDLERAVQLVPAASGMRLELVKLYRKLGHTEKAYQTVRDAKKWIGFEVDSSILIAFAKEAESIARDKKDDKESEYWAQVHRHVSAFGIAG
jgi:O-antigen ligase